jgi:hypothetical protein
LSLRYAAPERGWRQGDVQPVLGCLSFSEAHFVGILMGADAKTKGLPLYCPGWEWHSVGQD